MFRLRLAGEDNVNNYSCICLQMRDRLCNIWLLLKLNADSKFFLMFFLHSISVFDHQKTDKCYSLHFLLP